MLLIIMAKGWHGESKRHSDVQRRLRTQLRSVFFVDEKTSPLPSLPREHLPKPKVEKLPNLPSYSELEADEKERRIMGLSTAQYNEFSKKRRVEHRRELNKALDIYKQRIFDAKRTGDIVKLAELQAKRRELERMKEYYGL